MTRHLASFFAFVAMTATSFTAAAATLDVNQPVAQRTAWSTFLRSGPSETAPVIDELEHGSLVTINGCGGRWCRISDGRITGYIDKDALVLPGPASASAAGGMESCFVADQTGYRHPAPTQFCQTQPTDAAASH